VGSPFSVLIVGGGTAGWMAANLLAHHWRDLPVTITLVESSDIGTVGVGEGSTPYLKSFFRTLGIEESEWMPACNATYKCGIRFPNWSTKPGYTTYYHPFFSPLDRETGFEFFAQADARRRGENVVALPDHFFHAPYLSGAAMSPIPRRPLPFDLDYAYHFDAGLLGTFLKKKAREAGVVHRIETITSVAQADGEISYLETESGCRLQADLYVDCTGFRSQLLSALPGYAFQHYGNTLLNNSAVTLQLPRDPQAPLKTETVSEALSAGWMWDIPLQNRSGFGYVFSNDFVSPEQAEIELRARTGASDDVTCRHLSMRIGRVSHHWSGNCLGVGLSQGFIEPLEATALMLVQFTIEQFAADFRLGEHQSINSSHRDAYNNRINSMFSGVLDYVAGHYVLNSRNDTEYWRAARETIVVPDRLAEVLSCWDAGGDFTSALQSSGADRVYSSASWYCLLAGMGRFPALSESRVQDRDVGNRALLTDVEVFCSGNVDRFISHTGRLAQLVGR